MSLILKAIKFLRLTSIVDQIVDESFRYCKQFPSDLHFSHI